MTLQENKSTPDLGPTLDVIRDAVKSIQATKSQAQDLLRVIVNLQVSAANQHQLALDTLTGWRKRASKWRAAFCNATACRCGTFSSAGTTGEPADFFRNTGARVIGIESFAQ